MELFGFEETLTARKSWFMFDDEVVALGSGITSTDNRTIETIVQHKKLNTAGDNALTVNGGSKSTSIGWSETMSGTKWAHLAGTDIGYYFPDSPTIKGLRETRSGSWSEINDKGTTDIKTNNFMTLLFDHGANPLYGSEGMPIIAKFSLDPNLPEPPPFHNQYHYL